MSSRSGIPFAMAVSFLLLATAPALAEYTVEEIADLIPADGTVADIMAPGASPKIAEVTEKLQRVAAKDPEWWREYVKDLPSGTPIPYHPKMEISKEEYLEFLHLASEPGLIKYGELTLSVQKLEEGVYRLSAGDTVPEMDGIRIDLERDRVATPYGQAAKRTVISPSAEAQKMTGSWGGVQWEHLEMDTTAMRGLSIHFALGQMEETGEGILYYRIFKVNGSEPPTDVMVLLNYAVREK